MTYLRYALLLLFFSHPLLANFYEESEIQGFYFFEEGEPQTKEKPPQTPSEAADLIAEAKIELYELRCHALLSPTKENLIAYIRAQNRAITLAQNFSERWQMLLLDAPHLGGGVEAVTSSLAIEIGKEIEEKQKEKLLESLRNNFCLFLFAKGEEIASEEAAKVLHHFHLVTGWEIVVISFNQIPLKSFPNTIIDQGIAKKYAIQHSPSFLMINPETKEGYPVGIGLLSVTDLIDNIVKQAQRYQLETKE